MERVNAELESLDTEDFSGMNASDSNNNDDDMITEDEIITQFDSMIADLNNRYEKLDPSWDKVKAVLENSMTPSRGPGSSSSSTKSSLSTTTSTLSTATSSKNLSKSEILELPSDLINFVCEARIALAKVDEVTRTITQLRLEKEAEFKKEYEKTAAADNGYRVNGSKENVL